MRFILFLYFIMLTGCQAGQKADDTKSISLKQPQTIDTKRQDGAPKGPVPVKFTEVKPIDEPFSRYGNLAEYRVDGQTYEVMTSAKDYRARGVASWYGTKFHSKLTSSGEAYDLYGLTAAHKTLPLPTYVRVTNLKNGKTVVVKVNDRGPFHADRLIDLSYGAAAKLGFISSGTAPVEVETLPVNRDKKPAQFYLQAGAFSKETLAKLLCNQLKKITPTPVFIEQYKQYYLVKAGPFANKAKSDQLKTIFEQKGYHGIISVLH